MMCPLNIYNYVSQLFLKKLGIKNWKKSCGHRLEDLLLLK